MKSLRCVLFLFSCLALSISAFALFPSSPFTSANAAEPASSVNPWEGFYTGVSIGAVDFHTESIDYDAGSLLLDFGPHRGLKYGGTGALAGLTFGYNHQMGLWLLGLEADASLTSASGDLTVLGYGYNPSYFHAQLNGFGTLRLRGGYIWDNRTLFYVTAGLALNNIHSYVCELSSSNNGVCCACGFGYNVHQFRLGYVIGTGLEYAITPHWSVKAEGLYHLLPQKRQMDQFSWFPNVFYERRSGGLLFRIGLNYHF